MLQGENAWVFVNEECIADSVKSYHDFEKKLLEKYPKDKRKDMHPTAISGKSCCWHALLSCHAVIKHAYCLDCAFL